MSVCLLVDAADRFDMHFWPHNDLSPVTLLTLENYQTNPLKPTVAIWVQL